MYTKAMKDGPPQLETGTYIITSGEGQALGWGESPYGPKRLTVLPRGEKPVVFKITRRGDPEYGPVLYEISSEEGTAVGYGATVDLVEDTSIPYFWNAQPDIRGEGLWVITTQDRYRSWTVAGAYGAPQPIVELRPLRIPGIYPPIFPREAVFKFERVDRDLLRGNRFWS